MGVKIAPTRGCLGRREKVCQGEHEGHSEFRGMKSCVQGTTNNLTCNKSGAGSTQVNEMTVEISMQEPNHEH